MEGGGDGDKIEAWVDGYNDRGSEKSIERSGRERKREREREREREMEVERERESDAGQKSVTTHS